MSSAGTKCLRICGLIDKSLRPFTEEMASISKEKEKAILLALSQVLAKIQFWIQEMDCNSHSDDMVAELAPGYKCAEGSEPNAEDHLCLMKIIVDLVALLTIKSQYVQHLAGNVLIVISEFLVVSGSNWDDLIHSLSICMESVITTKILSSSTFGGSEDRDHGSTIFRGNLGARLKYANLSTLTGIVQVLRNILKFLKQEHGGHLVQVYFDSINSCLLKVPWISLDEILLNQKGVAMVSLCADGLCINDISIVQEQRFVFLGNFVQLICSLVDQRDFEDSTRGNLDNHPHLYQIINLVPTLLNWCLGKHGACGDLCLSQYFRHKLLVLMVRLSYQSHLGCSTLLLWLELLHNHFHEILWHPIEVESGKGECLEDSPFLLSISDGDVHSTLRSHHLQRLAIFLFLKCSCSLICLMSGHVEQHHVYTKCSGGDCGEKGLIELFKWLQGQLPSDMFSEQQMYSENCVKFASSFIQLYMQEDDLLFKMLLQMLNVPFGTQPRSNEQGMCRDVVEDIIFHVSNLFNPVILFHLFLAELCYDHQVLLDYLISKDAGIYCLEYILRCLRIVCDSWQSFVEFSIEKNVTNQSSFKRRKVLFERNKEKQISTENLAATVPSLKENKEDCKYKSNHSRTSRKPFKQAKECLFSLKSSVENLHRRNLFTYNPEVLLKRLERFFELCNKQGK